jgi:hypothetical protein
MQALERFIKPASTKLSLRGALDGRREISAMHAPLLRSSLAGVAMVSLAAGLAACGVGGNSSAPAPAVAPVAASAAKFSLGFVAAAPADIAKLTLIRHAQSAAVLPAAVDLTANMPPVGNQGQEGSCVAWASAYALRGYEARRDVWSTVPPKTAAPANNFSPAFVYNLLNGGTDSGLAIPWALSLMQQKGAATLADMPYVSGQYKTQPTAAALADALHYKLTSYGYIAPTDLTTMKTQLAAGLPIVLAIKVYYNFFLLGPNQVYSSISGAYQGGHAVTIVGYDDTKQAVEIINSWGTFWGTAGYGWIGYTALKQIAVEAYSAIDDHGVPGVTPTPTPTPTVKPSAAPVPSPTPTVKPSATPVPSPTPTVKPSATPVPSPPPTVKPSATPVPSPTPTVKPSATPVPSPPPTVKPSATPHA